MSCRCSLLMLVGRTSISTGILLDNRLVLLEISSRSSLVAVAFVLELVEREPRKETIDRQATYVVELSS